MKRVYVHNTDKEIKLWPLSRVVSLGYSGRGRWCHWVDSSIGGVDLAIRLGCGTIARDMSGLATLVAHLSCGVEWTTIRGGAVAGDVTLLGLDLELQECSSDPPLTNFPQA